MHRFGLLQAAIVALWLTAPGFGGDWGRYRGPAGNGISTEKNLPIKWDDHENVRWKVPLPAPGNSSPVVVGDRVFLTVATDQGSQRSLYCFERESGRELWMRTVNFDGEEPTHRTNHYGSASPAADDERVVVWHSSAGLHCYDHAGNQLWKRDLGSFIHVWGYGASPIIYRDAVILNAGPGERTFLIAVDKKTGNTIWKVDEPGGASGLVKADPDDKRPPWIGSWSTPIVVNVDGDDQILVSYPHQLKAYDPATGDLRWHCAGLGDLVYTDPIFTDGFVIAMSGFSGPAIGLMPGGKGDVTNDRRLWRAAAKIPQRIGSGVIVGKHVYMANEPGIAQCLEVETGREVWRARMPGGKIWGSIVAADGRFYVTNQNGDTIVFRPNVNEFELLAVNATGEGSNSTIAVSDGRIFLRTFKHLYCIQQQ